MDDIFSDMFSGIFCGGKSRAQGFGRGGFRQKGADLRAEVSVTFDEAAFGCNKILHLQEEDGKIQALQVSIPAGIDTGKTIRLHRRGRSRRSSAESKCRGKIWI